MYTISFLVISEGGFIFLVVKYRESTEGSLRRRAKCCVKEQIGVRGLWQSLRLFHPE
jgi:hypothetical protein